jgi:NADPH-dependent ferric siderophore reductase
MSRIVATRIPQAFVGRGIKTWPLAITAVRELGGAMRRLTLGGEALRSFVYEAGNDVMVPLAEDGGATVCRRYTIRHCDASAGRLDLDIVLHGEGIGARWAAAAEVGEEVEVGGPRGKVTLAKGAAWHLFAGDESAIPATLAMMEALPAGVPCRALLTVGGPGDEQPLDAHAAGRVTWVHRAEGEPSRGLVAAFEAVELWGGVGHVYVAGEDKLVASVKQAAHARKIGSDAISAKAYWARGSRNGEHGEP